MQKLRVLDLFSGIGGFTLGLGWAGGFETVAFCEIEPFAQKVLAKHWPDTPIHKDIRTLRGEDVGPVDLICGGYPCQPFSTAGKRRGKEDDRHLWPEFHRLVDELRPTWVIGENVAGHISMGLDDVLSDLEGSGYACRPFVIPACAIGAPHQRNRVWTLGHTAGERPRKTWSNSSRPKERFAGPGAPQTPLANARGIRREGRCDGRGEFAGANETSPRRQVGGTVQQDASPHATSGKRPQRGTDGRMGREGVPTQGDRAWQITSEPLVCRGTHGIPNRAHRLRGLGNAVVPQIPEIIGRAIMEAEHANLS